MIKLENIKISYNQGQQNEVIALQELNLEISKGQFVVVVGSNGSGKSTLLNVISGSVRPRSGRVLLNDRDITLLPDYKRSPFIARVFQNPLSGTAPDLTIVDNFRLAALRTQKKTLRIGLNSNFRSHVADRLSELGMGLENKLDQAMGTLSGGQRQAITLLMSVMDDLEVLLLDEPTAALDPRSAETVMRIADQLIKRHQLTALFITHHLKDVLNYGDRVIQMVDGTIKRDLSSEAKKNLTATEIYDWFMS
jgi:putative tryptophan/tyrosine transport system ATP-binding protein